ncbi:MAG: hypothetical protein EBT79_13300 [Actinobacteria bacterium]|nr:hypothetical protein [Actinomycetota bacterium]
MPGNDLNSKSTTLAGMMADAIAGPAAEALQRVAASGSPDNASKYAAAWAEMIPEGYVVLPVIRNGSGQIVKNDATQPYIVPVYPVSDERGYEVVGTYPYGRGFRLSDTDTLGKLLDPSGFSSEFAGVSGPDAVPNWDAVDAFIERLRSSDGTTAAVARVIGESGLDAAGKADLAASMPVSIASDSTIATALTGVEPGKTGMGSNTPASSAQGIGVFSPVNVAYGLADMTVARLEVCDCFTHQADVQLLRDPTTAGGYIILEGTEDDFEAYIKRVSSATVSAWSASQDNYRGYVVAAGDSRGVVDAFNDVRRAFTNPLGSPQVGAALSELDAAAGAVADAYQTARSIDPLDGIYDPEAGFSTQGDAPWETVKSKFTKGQS